MSEWCLGKVTPTPEKVLALAGGPVEVLEVTLPGPHNSWVT